MRKWITCALALSLCALLSGASGAEGVKIGPIYDTGTTPTVPGEVIECFAKNTGSINARANIRIVLADPSGPQLLASQTVFLVPGQTKSVRYTVQFADFFLVGNQYRRPVQCIVRVLNQDGCQAPWGEVSLPNNTHFLQTLHVNAIKEDNGNRGNVNLEATTRPVLPHRLVKLCEDTSL